jgi:hypothetical protein
MVSPKQCFSKMKACHTTAHARWAPGTKKLSKKIPKAVGIIAIPAGFVKKKLTAKILMAHMVKREDVLFPKRKHCPADFRPGGAHQAS